MISLKFGVCSGDIWQYGGSATNPNHGQGVWQQTGASVPTVEGSNTSSWRIWFLSESVSAQASAIESENGRWCLCYILWERIWQGSLRGSNADDKFRIHCYVTTTGTLTVTSRWLAVWKECRVSYCVADGTAGLPILFTCLVKIVFIKLRAN